MKILWLKIFSTICILQVRVHNKTVKLEVVCLLGSLLFYFITKNGFLLVSCFVYLLLWIATKMYVNEKSLCIYLCRAGALQKFFLKKAFSRLPCIWIIIVFALLIKVSIHLAMLYVDRYIHNVIHYYNFLYEMTKRLHFDL